MIGFNPDSGWPVYRTRSTPEALFMSILVMYSTKTFGAAEQQQDGFIGSLRPATQFSDSPI
jgi:hypothetical protein